MFLLLLAGFWIFGIFGAILLVIRGVFDLLSDVYIFYIAPSLGRTINLKETFGPWAIISGATDGIGKAYAKVLAGRCMNILLLGRNEKKLIAVEKELRAIKPDIKIKSIIHDFAHHSDGGEYNKLKNELSDVLMDTGILINNAGIFSSNPEIFGDKYQTLLPNPYVETSEVTKVNINSMLLLTSIVLPGMLQRKRGIIVNVSSVIAIHPLGGDAVYAATKSYMDFFTRSLRMDLKGTGVSVQGVYPGFVGTKIIPQRFHSRLSPVGLAEVNSYATNAVNSIGLAAETYGTITHRIQAILIMMFVRLSPLWIKESILNIVSDSRRSLNVSKSE